MSNDEDFFGGIDNIDPSVDGNIQIANGQTIKTHGTGSGTLNRKLSNQVGENLVQQVLYVPQLNCNMLSAYTLDRKDFLVQFGNGKYHVTQDGRLYAEAHLINGVYETNLSELQTENVAHTRQKDEADAELWQRS